MANDAPVLLGGREYRWEQLELAHALDQGWAHHGVGVLEDGSIVAADLQIGSATGYPVVIVRAQSENVGSATRRWHLLVGATRTTRGDTDGGGGV